MTMISEPDYAAMLAVALQEARTGLAEALGDLEAQPPRSTRNEG